MKKFEVNVNGNTYLLEYNRASFVALEEAGFNVLGADLRDKPYSAIYKCLKEGLKINHGNLSNEEKEAIVDAILNDYELGDLIEVTVEIIQSFFIQGENKKKVVRR